MRKSIINSSIVFILILLSLICSSCENFLDGDNPVNTIKETWKSYHENQLDRYKALSNTFGDLAQGGTNLFGISLSNLSELLEPFKSNNKNISDINEKMKDD